jgi:8-oxo-dGTP pyrophosphatase MutT (NUDIX family)
MALPHTEDKYGGVIVDDSAFDRVLGDGTHVNEFQSALGESLECWRSSGKRGVWLKLRSERCAYVPVAVREYGFEYHHAERDYVMLTKWLPDDGSDVSTIPANASHQVGVGAFVYDGENRKVLVVQELRGPASGRDLWKMPTGLLDQGEDIPDAARREVMEETGIATEFGAVVGCRHGHFGAFGKSDMFFCVALLVAPGASRTIKIQATEIKCAKWVSIDEFMTNPHIEPGSHAHALHSLCQRWALGDYSGIVARKLPLGFGRPGDVYTYVAADHLP